MSSMVRVQAGSGISSEPGADQSKVRWDTRSGGPGSEDSEGFVRSQESRVPQSGTVSLNAETAAACANGLPLEPKESQKKESSQANCYATAPGAETILLVEDDDAVRALADQVLRKRGHRVLKAASGAEALQLSQKFGERIDLLLTDAVMPEMGGLELAECIARQRPETRILLMSGYCDKLVEAGALKLPFLPKPFSPQELVTKVAELLQSAVPTRS